MIVPKVYGIGFGKTGTSSLTRALRRLGYRTAHWAEVYDSLRMDLTLPREFYLQYDAILDGTMPLRYPKLWTPDDKFILTTRDVNEWYDSVVRHRRKTSATKLKRKLRKALYETEGLHPPTLKYAFLRHEIHVKNFFRDKDNLLIMDICDGDGWEKLCGFLGKGKPGVPFPHENKSKERK